MTTDGGRREGDEPDGHVDPGDRHITFREFKTELKSFRNETRLLIVGVVVLLRFDVPEQITAAAVLAVIAKAAWTFGTLMHSN